MNNDNKTITPFLFGENLIRTENRDDGPRFVIADVCTILEHSNPSMIIARLHPDDLSTTEVIDSLGRKQNVNTCNESGLYCLIFQSRKPIAREFTRWVTSEVLPQIRRTGSYNSAHQAYLGLIADQLRMGVSPDLAARCASKLCPAVAILPKRFAHEPSSDSELQEILDLMHPDTAYSIEDVVRLLPVGHRLRRGNKHAQASAVGKVMIRGRGQSRLQKIPGRYAKYQLPSIVAITAERS